MARKRIGHSSWVLTQRPGKGVWSNFHWESRGAEGGVEENTVRTLSCRSRQVKTEPIADGCLGFGRPQQTVDRLDPVPDFEKELSEEPVIDGADKVPAPGRKNVRQRFEPRRAKPGPLIRHYDDQSRRRKFEGLSDAE